jgi:hypothetical protein
MTAHEFLSPDVTTRTRALAEDIARKTSVRPKVDNQGRRIGEPVAWVYDAHGKLLHRHEPLVEDAVQPIVEPVQPIMKPNPAQGSGGSGHTGGPEEAIQAATQAGKHELAIQLKQQAAAHARQLRGN